MIKRLVLAALLMSGFTEALLAEENQHGSKMYMVVKALFTTGEKVEHDATTTLESDSGHGFGVDFGYKVTHNVAVEFDFSYDENDVTVDDGTTPFVVEGTYYTYAADVTYTHHMTKSLGLMAKVGYELEQEELEGTHTNETGLVYGIALEYVVSKHYEVVAEYEASTIESPRGHSIFLGVKRNF